MTLNDLFSGIPHVTIPASIKNKNIVSITADSREVISSSIFFALAGSTCKGEDFIQDAVQKGALAVITGQPGSIESSSCVLIVVVDPYQTLKECLLKFYGDPNQTVKGLGVTGTNGKTTITYLLESVLEQAKKKCAVIGTINHRVAGKTFASKNTTPGLVDNHLFLTDLAKKQVPYCAMEVSSHALAQGRVDLIDFKVAIFTNLTQDHLDYHKNMEDYFQAKALLFTRLSPKSHAVINIDDAYGQKLVGLTKAKVWTYGINRADIQAANIQVSPNGSHFTIKTPDGDFSIETRLIGLHNVYNILATVGACLAENISVEDIQKGISKLANVPGRLQPVLGGQDFSVFVDYAHTEDALYNVLKSLKKFNSGKIILVFGCGGNRDKTKRPKMGKIAAEYADWSVITSDNPRNEDPERIIQEIVSGFEAKSNYEIIVDRKSAIERALRLAKKGEILLIAGKGHEDYQIFKDKKIHFDDREVALNFFSHKSVSVTR